MAIDDVKKALSEKIAELNSVIRSQTTALDAKLRELAALQDSIAVHRRIISDHTARRDRVKASLDAHEAGQP